MKKTHTQMSENLSPNPLHETQIHGVFMNMFNLGVMIIGESGIGKSEAALSLIDRGHSLIADDSVIFQKVGPKTIIGHSPPLLKDFLEVWGLGILDVRAMFGDIAVKNHKELNMFVGLCSVASFEFSIPERLHGIHREHILFDTIIPEVSIPVGPEHRNIAVLIEGAVRNQLLRQQGYLASDEFIKRQKKNLNTHV